MYVELFLGIGLLNCLTSPEMTASPLSPECRVMDSDWTTPLFRLAVGQSQNH